MDIKHLGWCILLCPWPRSSFIWFLYLYSRRTNTFYAYEFNELYQNGTRDYLGNFIKFSAADCLFCLSRMITYTHCSGQGRRGSLLNNKSTIKRTHSADAVYSVIPQGYWLTLQNNTNGIHLSSVLKWSPIRFLLVYISEHQTKLFCSSLTIRWWRQLHSVVSKQACGCYTTQAWT